ncbi:Protein of unknown function [Gryllus bimaculatus]|nr:Protein of unknown function [Gryllus bimaculatus]
MENIQILAENIIQIDEVKEEPLDHIGESTLISIVKQEPDDHAVDHVVNLPGGGELCSLKREVKQEDEVQADVLTRVPYIAGEVPNQFDSAHCRMFALLSTERASGIIDAAIDATSSSSIANNHITAAVTTENNISNNSGNVMSVPAVISIMELVSVNIPTASPEQEYVIENPANIMTPRTNERRQKTSGCERLKKLVEDIKKQEEMHKLMMQKEKKLHDLRKKYLEKQLRNEELKEKILLKELENSKK